VNSNQSGRGENESLMSEGFTLKMKSKQKKPINPIQCQPIATGAATIWSGFA
jgi:hypothetical protein